jgi:hypothetical protein
MPRSDAPLNRSIGVAGVVRWLIAAAAVMAVGAAFANGHYAMGGAAIVFFVGAVGLGYRAWCARHAADSSEPHD